MTWDEIVSQYIATYATIAGGPMSPMRRSFALTLLRDRSVEQIQAAIAAVKAAAGTEGKYAVQKMTKFENGSWQP